MPILDAHGEVIEGRDKAELEVAATGSVKLAFRAGGGRVVVDEDGVLRFPEGEWIIMPLGIWTSTLARALATEQAGLSRQQRRARARQN